MHPPFLMEPRMGSQSAGSNVNLVFGLDGGVGVGVDVISDNGGLEQEEELFFPGIT